MLSIFSCVCRPSVCLLYIMIKGSIQEENITLLNINEPNTGTSISIKQILTNIKGEIDNNMVITGDITTRFY